MLDENDGIKVPGGRERRWLQLKLCRALVAFSVLARCCEEWLPDKMHILIEKGGLVFTYFACPSHQFYLVFKATPPRTIISTIPPHHQ